MLESFLRRRGILRDPSGAVVAAKFIGRVYRVSWWHDILRVRPIGRALGGRLKETRAVTKTAIITEANRARFHVFPRIWPGIQTRCFPEIAGIFRLSRSLLNRDNVSLTKMNEFDVSPSFRCFAFSIRAWRKRNGIQDEMEESFGTRIRLLLGEEWIEFGTPFVRTHPRFSHDDPCELLIVFASPRMSNRGKYWW